MKTELLEKLKAAKSKEEVADLISDAKKTDEVKALSPEDLDDVAGGTGEEEFDWKGMLITVSLCSTASPKPTGATGPSLTRRCS